MRGLITIAAVLVCVPAYAQDGSAYHNAPRSPIIATYPLTSAGALPPCLAADNCEMRCAVGLGNALLLDEWGCEDENFNPIAVTNAAGDGTADCLGITNGCIKVTSDATAPYIAAATAAAAGFDTLWTQPHTLLLVGFTDGTNSSTPVLFSYGKFNNSGGYVQLGASTTQCRYASAVDIVSTVASNSGTGKYSVSSCVQTSDTDRHARANGAVGTTVTTSLTVVAPTVHNMYFGRYDSTGFASHGYLRAVYIYSSAQSAASTTAFESTIYGTTGTTQVTTVRDTTRPCAHGSTYDVLGPDMPCVDPTDGLFVGEGTTNDTVYSSLDGSTWPRGGGTGTYTGDTDSGPFADFNVGPEADTLDDTDVTANTFWNIATNTTATDGNWTMSLLLKAGTSSSARLQVLCDGGTGSTLCDVITLTSALVRYECTATCASITGVTARLYPTDTVAVSTGSVIVSGVQLEQSSYATPICLSTGAATTCDADAVTVDSTGWPTTQGRVSMTFTPWTADNPNSVHWLLKCDGSSVGWGMYINSLEQFLFRTGDGTLVTLTGNTQTFTVGTPILAQFAWDASGNNAIFLDGTEDKRNTLGKVIPSIPDPCFLGQNGAGVFSLNGSIRNLEIRR